MLVRITVALDRETKAILERQAEALESIAGTLEQIEQAPERPVVDALNSSFDPPARQ